MSFRDHPKDMRRRPGTGGRHRRRTQTWSAAPTPKPRALRLAGGLLWLCLVPVWTLQAAEPGEVRRPQESKQRAPTEGVKKTGKVPSKLRRFVPTEKITADSAISFPVDI